MEISRNINAGYSAPAEATAGTKTEAAAPAKPSAVAQKPEPRLEQLQAAMRALPEIDMDQVMAIKQAMARGDLSSDVSVLAQSILAYHRSSDI
jgi:negative regulator of flagellin synthesis FlgM